MIWEIAITTMVFELIYCSARFLAGSSREFFGWKRVWVHLGYLGFIFIPMYFVFKDEHLLIVGLALIFAEILHHFVVLPLWVKDTEFP